MASMGFFKKLLKKLLIYFDIHSSPMLYQKLPEFRGNREENAQILTENRSLLSVSRLHVNSEQQLNVKMPVSSKCGTIESFFFLICKQQQREIHALTKALLSLPTLSCNLPSHLHRPLKNWGPKRVDLGFPGSALALTLGVTWERPLHHPGFFSVIMITKITFPFNRL